MLQYLLVLEAFWCFQLFIHKSGKGRNMVRKSTFKSFLYTNYTLTPWHVLDVFMNQRANSLVMPINDTSPGLVITMTVFGLSHFTFVFPGMDCQDIECYGPVEEYLPIFLDTSRTTSAVSDSRSVCEVSSACFVVFRFIVSTCSCWFSILWKDEGETRRKRWRRLLANRLFLNYDRYRVFRFGISVVHLSNDLHSLPYRRLDLI